MTATTYQRGRVEPANLRQLKADSARRHVAARGALLTLAQALPPSYDARTKGTHPAIWNQSNCGCMPGTDEVLTTEGWQRWENYDWETPLGTMNQQTGRLEFQMPEQQHIYDYDGPLYYSDNRSVDFALTPNHRLFLQKWDEARRTLDEEFQFVEVQKMGWYAGLPHATTGWLGTELERLGVGDRVYHGDDFLALVALIISDGWAGGDKEGTRNQVGFCCFRQDRIDKVRALAHRLGLHEQPSRPGYWLWSDGALAEWLRQNAYANVSLRSPNKRVPDLVKVASQRQIEHFLQFFGDQHVEKEGTRRFYSSSRQMIDDMQELLLRTGKRGTIEERSPREAMFQGRVIKSNGPELTLTERRTDRLSLDRKSHLRTDHFKGKVYCATVPNSTLVTRRNGSILISGNSCWDFSGTAVVNVALIKAGVLKQSDDLSTQYTLDCYRTGGCNGDDNTTVLEHAKQTGIPTAADYGPYDARSEHCKQVTRLLKIDDWGFVDGHGDGVTSTDLIKAAIMSYDIVGCAVAAGSDWDNVGPNSTITGRSTGIDHDVALVGWDDNHDNGNGTKGAWIMRNSWGTDWAGGGYAWIKYGAASIGTEAVYAVVAGQPVPPPPPPPPPTPPPIPPTPPPAVGLVLDLTGQTFDVFGQPSGSVKMTGTATTAQWSKGPCGCDGKKAMPNPLAVIADVSRFVADLSAGAAPATLVADLEQLALDLGGVSSAEALRILVQLGIRTPLPL